MDSKNGRTQIAFNCICIICLTPNLFIIIVVRKVLSQDESNRKANIKAINHLKQATASFSVTNRKSKSWTNFMTTVIIGIIYLYHLNRS